MERDKLTEKIIQLAEARDMSMNALRLKAGIDHGNWTRLKQGRRKWRLEHLESVARALGISLIELINDRPTIPIIAECSADEGFTLQKLFVKDKIGGAPNLFWEGSDTATRVYALRVKDRSMLPVFPPGTIFYAERGSSQKICNESLVVYCDENGEGHIRQILIAKENIILKGLHGSVKDLILPPTHLKLCDLILHATFPA